MESKANMFEHRSERTIEPILMTAREAARALTVCEKTLWTLTQPRGKIPAVRIGKAVRYRMEDLQAWIEKKVRESSE